MDEKVLVMIGKEDLDDIKQCVEDLKEILVSISKELQEFNEIVSGKLEEDETELN